jgi:hypothetical protein
MKIDITINICDVENLVRAEVERRFPNCELGDLTVKSWNTTVFRIVDGKLDEPAHIIRQDHCDFK